MLMTLRRTRPTFVYALVAVLGCAAFLYPFFLPASALPDASHTGDAPLLAAAVGALVVIAVLLEVRRGSMTVAAVAMLGVLSAAGGLLRILDLPGGGNGIFFLIVLAGAAFGPRFGLLLGLCSMAVGAILTGGIGPWLPFQMLALGALGVGGGLVGRAFDHRPIRLEVFALAVYGWFGAFLYGAIMNLWFWPFTRNGGELSWHPGLGFAQTVHHYWSFYVATSFAWDAAGAFANAALILLTGAALLPSLRRFAHRLAPAVMFE
jgi:energy-coupling factor transport system substrate-specific component